MTTETTPRARGMGLNEFLNSGSDYTKGRGYLSGWKKDGEITVWLHRQTWAAKSWNHPVPKVVEMTDKDTDEKKLIVLSDRWHCHEAEELLMRRYDRDNNDRRNLPPVVCPSCILGEVLRELVADGKLAWTDPVFQWDGSDRSDKLVIRAGGAYGAFNTKDVEKDRAALAELKRAGIDRSVAFKQNLGVRLQWLFVVANADKIEDGIQMTFESKALGEKMKKCVRDEMRRNSRNPSLGNPVDNPYPFKWSYDENGNFDDKFDVLALTNEKPSAEVLKVIDGSAPDIDNALAFGNCWELKNELESHLIKGIELPWDRIFGPADKAGLMVQPEDSKADKFDPEELGGSDSVPDVRTKGSGKKLDVVRIDQEHAVWFDEPKPDATVKGKSIELIPPGDASPEEIDLASKTLIEWGAERVGLLDACDYCEHLFVLDFEVDCPKCGSQYAQSGAIETHPCLSDPKHQVKLEGEGPRYICGDCGTIHELLAESPDVYGSRRWKLIEKPEPSKAETTKQEAPKRRRIGAEAPKEEAPKDDAPRRRRTVPFDAPGAK